MLVGRSRLGIIDGLGSFRRHVVLVVLGQHNVCPEASISLDTPFRDHTLPFAHETRKLAAKDNRGIRHRIRNQQLDLGPIPLDAGRLDADTDTDALARQFLWASAAASAAP